MTDPHDLVVKAGLTADQFLWLRNEAEALGLSQSGMIRLLIQQERRRQALTQITPNDHAAASADPGRE